MFNEFERDSDIDARALDRWSGEGGATRSLKPPVEKQRVQVLRLRDWAPDVFYDLWRSSCEMPDAPHLGHAAHNCEPVRLGECEGAFKIIRIYTALT
jgi:hypothetical protein